MFEIVTRAYADPDVTRMVAAVQQEYVQMYGGPDEAAVDPGEFDPPAGLLHVGLLDDAAVAMGGWRLLPPAETGSAVPVRMAELKRMYVAAQVRGRGLSHLILEAIEHSAADAGVELLVLNTGPVQRAAISLYERSGYLQAPPFGHYATMGGALFYGKRLVPVAR